MNHSQSETNHSQSATNSRQGEALSFEQSLAALEQAVRQLEDGELDLAGALAAFENGIRHLKCCYARLEDAERRIELLSGVDSTGHVDARPLADEDLSLEEKQQTRSRRRSHVAPPSSPPASAPSEADPLLPFDEGDNVDGDGRLF